MIASTARRLRHLLTYAINILILKSQGVRYGSNLRINGILYIHNQGRIEIGDNVTINSGARYNPIGGQSRTRLIVGPNAELKIGQHVGISNSTLVAYKSITLGNHAMVGGSCNIWDTDFHATDHLKRRESDDRGACEPVDIGPDAFIGAHAIITKGVAVPARAVIGAGSVLRRGDMPRSP
jgi:acetyltransferase-like isoleucine patch superfamily enzyme